MSYDVIIAGASFAGLAVAAQLRGKRVLLLDPKPIGAGQTSACGTLVSTLKSLGLEASIRQIHNRLVLHTSKRTFVFSVADDPFCTFDYEHLCRLLYAQGNATFVQVPAQTIRRNGVQTPRGHFSGDIVVDATGWRAVLAKERRPNLIRQDRLNFGLETVTRCNEDGLHFWYDPGSLQSRRVAWVFPAGDYARIGIGSYKGETRLKDGLEYFLQSMNLRGDGFHGGYFTHALREPVVDGVFLVGDAAGQCLALTGEGIRPALFFGARLGRLLRRLLDGEIDRASAQQQYVALVKRRRFGYELLCMAQRVLPRLPLPVLEILMALSAQPRVVNRIMHAYSRAFRLDEPGAEPTAMIAHA